MESSNFSSLLSLADSYLSITKLSEPTIATKPLTNESKSETIMTPSRSQYQTEVLDRQISNMLKRKEEDKLRKQEEEIRIKKELNTNLLEEMKEIKLEEQDNYIVDLMKAIEFPYVSVPFVPKEEVPSNRASFESELENKDIERSEPPKVLLECTTDISHIIFKKVWKGKCSAFGKVLRSRIKPIAAPYIFESYTSVKPFDFKTKSPCDLIIEKRNRPSRHNTYSYEHNMKIIMGDEI